MAKSEGLKKIDASMARVVESTALYSPPAGGGASSGNADTVDGFHASATPVANYLLALNGSGQFPAAVMGGIDAQYLVMVATPSLANERALTAGAGLTLTDGGAGGAATLAVVAADTSLTINPDSMQVRLATTSGLQVSTGLLVGQGDGLTVGANTVSLTTPGTLSVSSTNAAAGSHTHAITASSNPGAATALLKSDTSGYLQLLRLGIGVAPSYALHLLSTSTQARISYSVDYYADLIVGTTGNLTVQTVGDIVLDPTGDDVLPRGSKEVDLGSYNRMWRTLCAAELYVETLVAQYVMATIGGRIVVAPTTKLIADLSGTNRLGNGDFETAGGGGADVFAVWGEVASDGAIVRTTTAGEYHTDSGGAAAKLTAGPTLNTRIYQTYTVVPGKGYAFSFWTRGDLTNAGRYMVYDDTNAANIIALASTGITSATFTSIHVSFTAPALCTQVSVQLYCPAVNAGWACFDDAALFDGWIDVEHNNLADNDYLWLQAAPGGIAQYEVMQVTDGPTTITGGFRYTVTRWLDGTAANTWYTGDAVVNYGYTAGEGYIDITSTQTILNHLGPTITIYARSATALWNSMTPVVTMGNLDSFCGYGAEYGFAVGNNLTLEAATGFKGLTADRTNGVTLYSTGINLYDAATKCGSIHPDGDFFFGSNVTAAATTSLCHFATAQTYNSESMGAGDVMLGDNSASAFNLFWDYSDHALMIRRQVTPVFKVDADTPMLLFGSDVTAAATTAIMVNGADQLYNGEALGTGDLLLGDNTASKANVLWDKSAGTLLFRGGTTTQAYVHTDGHIMFGGGKGGLASGGLNLTLPADVETETAIDWLLSTAVKTRIAAFSQGDNTSAYIQVVGTAGDGMGVFEVDLDSYPGGAGGYENFYLRGNGTAYWTGKLFLGAPAINANMTKGLNIDQGTAVDEALVLKSTDVVAHGMTTLTETTTYAVMKKVSATGGGLLIAGLTDTDAAAYGAVAIQGYLGEAADTTKSTSGHGVVRIQALVKSGTSATDVGTDGNLLTVENNATTRFILDAEGSFHADVESTTFDQYDDLALLEALDVEFSRRRGNPISQEFGRWLQEHKAILQQERIVNFYDDGPRAMLNMTRLAMLHTGALRQMGKRLQLAETRLGALPPI